MQALQQSEQEVNAAETDPIMLALGLPYPTCVGKIHGGEWASSVMDRVVVRIVASASAASRTRGPVLTAPVSCTWAG